MTESFKQYGIKRVILISNAASFFVQIFVQKIWHNLLHTQDDSCAESVSFFCMATTTTTKTAFDNLPTPESEILNVTDILYLI